MTGTLHEDVFTFLIISRSFLLRMRNVSDKICSKNQNTLFTFSNFFFRKSSRSWQNVEKYLRAGQATDDNMAHAHCMLDTYGYKHTLRVCITYCFSTAQCFYERTLMLRYMYIASLVRLQKQWRHYYTHDVISNIWLKTKHAFDCKT